MAQPLIAPDAEPESALSWLPNWLPATMIT
jgi:hypothetical protein